MSVVWPLQSFSDLALVGHGHKTSSVCVVLNIGRYCDVTFVS